MSISNIILWIMAIGIMIGALDRITGNHFGLGTKFEEGLNLMGPLAIGMVGIVCLAPVIANILKPFVLPICTFFHVDPSILGCITANDMGGYQLSMELMVLPEAGKYFGNIVSSMLGCTLAFTIPVGLGIIQKDDNPYFSRGLLYGFITIPIGCFLGGLVAGFSISMLIPNTIPVLIISILLSIGIKLIPRMMIKGCIILGKIITTIIIIGLACAAFQEVTGVVIIPGMLPIMEAMESVSSIAIILMGTFPILSIFSKIMEKPLQYVGRKVHLDNISIMGLIVSTANGVPVFGTMKDMTKRGIVVVTAWMVSASAVFGDHLGFTTSVEPSMTVPMIAAKLSASVFAAILALYSTRNMKEKS